MINNERGAIRPPSPNNKNGYNLMTNNKRRAMRPPSSNNKNESTSTAFKLTLLIMEQYQQDQQNQQMILEMFMKQQAIQTKLIIDTSIVKYSKL